MPAAPDDLLTTAFLEFGLLDDIFADRFRLIVETIIFLAEFIIFEGPLIKTMRSLEYGFMKFLLII